MKIELAEGQKCFVTSDHHFGHENIIGYTDRPYSSILSMDRDYARKWNKVVRPGDLVFHLGDFTLNDGEFARQMFSGLRGLIYVLSNPDHHDKRWQPVWSEFAYNALGMSSLDRQPVILLPPLITLTFPQMPNEAGYPTAVVLCHYPLEQWDRSHHESFHFHGHVHEDGYLTHIRKRMNVGVDFWQGYPVGMKSAMKAAEFSWPEKELL